MDVVAVVAVDARCSMLDVLCRRGSRFVLVGSAGCWLLGESVCPNDLDIVADTTLACRPMLVDALVDLHAGVECRWGRVPVSSSMQLPWDWGWRATTAYGPIDVVTRFIDDTTFEDHDRLAVTVTLPSGNTVKCHPTRRAA